MSLPDDETRDQQDQDNLKPDETEAGWTEESLGLGDDLMDENLFGSDLSGDIPETAADDGDVNAAPADESDQTLDFAAPADTESGIAFQAMGMDDEAAADSGGVELDETLDFAAPADTESGVAFQAMGMEDEAAVGADAEGANETLDFAAPADMESGVALQAMGASEESAEGNEFLLGLAADTGDFTVEGESAADAVEEEEEDTKKPGKRLHRVLAAVGGTDPYTVLMGIALLALLFGVLFFYLELSSYDFDIGAEKAKQLVGAIGLGWLL